MHVLRIECTDINCISFSLCLSDSLLLNITFVAVLFGTVRIAMGTARILNIGLDPFAVGFSSFVALLSVSHPNKTDDF
jgi:hypothetical protein